MYLRLKSLREERGVTQNNLATILFCSQQVYSNYELGQRDIPTQVLIDLANFYNVSIDYLLGQTDNPKRYKQTK